MNTSKYELFIYIQYVTLTSISFAMESGSVCASNSVAESLILSRWRGKLNTQGSAVYSRTREMQIDLLVSLLLTLRELQPKILNQSVATLTNGIIATLRVCRCYVGLCAFANLIIQNQDRRTLSVAIPNAGIQDSGLCTRGVKVVHV